MHPVDDDEAGLAEAEFADFVRARSTALHRTAYLLTGSREAAQDAVQSALTRVYQAWPRRAAWASRDAYARQVLVNVVLTARQRRWTGEQPRSELADQLLGSTPDFSAVAGERDVLRRALDRLPVRQRTAVVLRHYLDLSEAATAAEMGCPVGTVKSLTARALSALKGHLEEIAS